MNMTRDELIEQALGPMEGRIVEVKAKDLRAYFDGGDLPEDLQNEFDKAQGDVTTGQITTYYIVVKVV
jgi:hypothetical protein